MKMRDENYMREALDLARSALEQEELPIAALLVHEERIIACAHNRVAGRCDLLAHAEMLVIQTVIASKDKFKIAQRRAMTLYTTLEPCMMCFGAVMNYNVGRLCYALESPGDGVLPIVHQWEKKSEQLPYYRAPNTEGGILRADSALLFREFGCRYPKSRFAHWTTQLANLAGAGIGGVAKAGQQ